MPFAAPLAYPDPQGDPRLQEIARVLIDSVHPELVLLFGSRARGDARDDSDFDVMLVLSNSTADIEEGRRAACRALRPLPVSVDVLARSVAEYERCQRDPGFLDFMVAREGLLLYASGAIPQRSPGGVREGGHSRDGVAMWLARADSDLRIARQSIDSPDPSIDAICFHAHAAVEKWLKALIVLRARQFPPKTHDLVALLSRQSPDVRANAAVMTACGLLMQLYPKSRSPESGMPEESEARAAIAAAQTVREVVLPLLAARGAGGTGPSDDWSTRGPGRKAPASEEMHG